MNKSAADKRIIELFEEADQLNNSLGEVLLKLGEFTLKAQESFMSDEEDGRFSLMASAHALNMWKRLNKAIDSARSANFVNDLDDTLQQYMKNLDESGDDNMKACARTTRKLLNEADKE